VVAVAVGNILQRSQDVWALGPQPALERAAQELQSLTGPVPRGMQTPPNPAVVLLLSPFHSILLGRELPACLGRHLNEAWE
jgi:hypothetical protein